MAANQVELEVQLERMPQLTEAVDKEDNWTGLTDAAARRKRQNRLNVRAFRRRKVLQLQASADLTSIQSTPETQLACWIEDQQIISLIPASRTRTDPRTPGPHYFPTSQPLQTPKLPLKYHESSSLFRPITSSLLFNSTSSAPPSQTSTSSPSSKQSPMNAPSPSPSPHPPPIPSQSHHLSNQPPSNPQSPTIHGSI